MAPNLHYLRKSTRIFKWNTMNRNKFHGPSTFFSQMFFLCIDVNHNSHHVLEIWGKTFKHPEAFGRKPSQMAQPPTTWAIAAMVQSISKARDFARYAAQTWKEVIVEKRQADSRSAFTCSPRDRGWNCWQLRILGDGILRLQCFCPILNQWAIEADCWFLLLAIMCSYSCVYVFLSACLCMCDIVQ